MGIRELGLKYGRGNGRTLFNRAIRAELLAGTEMLDALHEAMGGRAACERGDFTDAHAQLSKVCSLLGRANVLMRNAIAAQYGMEQEVVDEER